MTNPVIRRLITIGTMKELQNETHHTKINSPETITEKNLTIFVRSFGKDPAKSASNNIMNTKEIQIIIVFIVQKMNHLPTL